MIPIQPSIYRPLLKYPGRLDAEYYQPKYDGYLSALEQFETTKIPNEFDVLKTLERIMQKGSVTLV